MKCYKAGTITTLQVTTNSMPNHCYNAYASGGSHPTGTANFDDIIKYTWTVDFNKYPLDMFAAAGLGKATDLYFSNLST